MWNRRTFPVITFGLLIVAIIGHSLALAAVWLVVMAGYAVSVHLGAFDALRQAAVTGDDARRLITAAAADLRAD